VTVNDQDWLAERFETSRPQLRAVAYRMLGSLSEADDAVQEAWLRLSRSDVSGIESLSAWLTTVVGRVCLDMLRARRSRSEQPLAGRLPDLLVDRVDGIDPEHEALLGDSVGLALLVVLETPARPTGSTLGCWPSSPAASWCRRSGCPTRWCAPSASGRAGACTWCVTVRA
jgi:RNA polymerase sigma-70 factor (ECF subfamily)